MKNKKMTTINAKTILFAGLILTLIVPIAGINIVRAENNQIPQLEQQMEQKIKQIQQESELSKNSEIIKNLESDYYELNQAYNEITQITPKIDYVNEWKTRDLQIMALDAQQRASQKAIDTLQENLDSTIITDLKPVLKEEIKQMQNEMNKRDQKINSLKQEIIELERQSIEFHKLTPQLEQKLNDIEKYLSNTHVDEKSSDFVGENPVEVIRIDNVQKKVVVMIDKERSSVFSPAVLAQRLVNTLGSEYVMIEFAVPELVSCTGSTPMSECRPLVGGIALARYDAPTTLAGSIGYKATKGTDTGFVTAAHVVDFSGTGNTKMLQPVNGAQVGTATIIKQGRSNGDYAFVKTTVSINDDIFINSSSAYDIASYASSSEHTSGSFLYKVGATSNLSWGSITGSIPSAGMITTSIPVSGGDSGGSVFKVISGTSVKIFGHITENHSGAYYTTVNHLINGIYNIVPATT